MKLSIASPVVSLHPGAHRPWEDTATVAADATIISVGRAQDSLAEYLEYLAALEEVSAEVG